MDRKKALAALIITLLLAGCSRSRSATGIRVGSKNFTEQVLLGEIIAQHLERRLQVPIVRKLNLGGTLLAHQALTSGEIDLYPEYTGTAIATVVKQSAGTEAAKVLDRVRTDYAKRFQVDWLNPLGIDNGFAMVISGIDARDNNLESLTDAAKAQPWQLGAGYEFDQRADGLAALNNTYSLRWKSRPRTMDLGLLYKALEQGQVSMIAANATDGLLSKLDLRVLRDDKHAFPPYEVAIAVRQDSQQRVPGLREALSELSGKFSNSIMQKLNYEVDAEHRPVSQVAAAFLKTLDSGK